MLRIKQKGQAIPEVLAIGIVMVPLFLMIPIMGKVADMNQKTIMAARYGAWERTIKSPTKKPDDTIRREARLRFFGRNDTYIKTNDIVQEKDAYRSLLWRTADDKPMLRRFSDVKAGRLATAPPAPNFVHYGFRTADYGLNVAKLERTRKESDPIYRSSFSVSVATNKLEAFKRGTNCGGGSSSKTLVCIERHNAIYTDTWNSGNRGMAASQARGMMLTDTGIIKTPVNLIKKSVGSVFLFKEFKLFTPGYVVPDELPADRKGSRIWFQQFK